MKIAVITPVYPPYSSGMSRVAEEEVKMLEEEGFDVTVFTPSDASVSSVNNDDYKNSGAIRVFRLKPFLKYGNGSLIPQFVRHLSDFDIIHIHYPFIGASEILLLWKKIFGKGKRLFVTYQLDLQGKGIVHIFFNLYNSIITPSFINSSSTVMFTSMDYAESSVFYPLFKKNSDKGELKLAEIPGPVDTKRFRPAGKRDDLMKRYNLRTEDKVALFVGSLDRAHYFKGIPVLLSSFEKYCLKSGGSNVRLLIAGDGDLKNEYAKQALDSSVLQERVVFAGRISEDDLPSIYNLGDFIVLPSTDSSEAFGIVIAEGYASGKPALASNLPGVRSVIIKGETGLLSEPSNRDDLSEKLAFMFNKAPLDRWGKKAREIAEIRYSRKVVKEKFISLFRNS